ncbi:ribonuclease HII [Candidatus Falkowbacteria bacterium RIFOXYB2_FULL_47_14]|uniref:Ribonuclease HII n=1 Tax=Candidatus Falkowbacteria bacterium RIFOXYA2_FULL_47_19 TaxID=1797994 RepID=A0A1F5SGG6_9BACT|nr:MAG: ribonuclease HII [Candidatus Falkowbacteria bacterium RIFOXYA2_FULL_47_19]OGF34931.1 MAG: ribonuclease HII [Candidatus Falkowbacteria bacterium RIFOXYC2_FULL_46_15]OGF43646.1 MAG: ribonuclease HII [Candidatus Falkowbacteria bacterium RIFOXYB2_FULL_47_14]
MLNLKEEENLFTLGYRFVGGLDEAGRGPLAGPVVAACVICERDHKINMETLKDVKDSKKLTEKKREKLFGLIQENVFEVGVGVCDQDTIDRINIFQASLLAMKKAIGALKNKPEFIMLDGKFPIPNISLKQRAIIGGDNLVFSIAAASIIAKVTRDRIMRTHHEEYPEYGFDKHKGYGTKFHIEQLAKHGPCRLHRKSFEPIRKFYNNTANILKSPLILVNNKKINYNNNVIKEN